MGLFGMSWGTIAGGVASGVGFALGGPVGAAVLGGVTTTLVDHYADGQSWGDSLRDGAISGALGAVGGGFAGGAVKGTTMQVFKDGVEAFTAKGLGKNLLTRGGLAVQNIARRKLGTVAATVAAGYGNNMFDPGSPTTAPGSTGGVQPLGSIPTVPLTYVSA